MNGPFESIVVDRTEVEELIVAAQAAMDGDSNDAEHDALVSIVDYLISIATLRPIDVGELKEDRVTMTVWLLEVDSRLVAVFGRKALARTAATELSSAEMKDYDVVERTVTVDELARLFASTLKEEEYDR